MRTSNANEAIEERYPIATGIKGGTISNATLFTTNLYYEYVYNYYHDAFSRRLEGGYYIVKAEDYRRRNPPLLTYLTDEVIFRELDSNSPLKEFEGYVYLQAHSKMCQHGIVRHLVFGDDLGSVFDLDKVMRRNMKKRGIPKKAVDHFRLSSVFSHFFSRPLQNAIVQNSNLKLLLNQR